MLKTFELAKCESCGYKGELREFQGGLLIQDLQPLYKTRADMIKNFDELERKFDLMERKCPKCQGTEIVAWHEKREVDG